MSTRLRASRAPESEKIFLGEEILILQNEMMPVMNVYRTYVLCTKTVFPMAHCLRRGQEIVPQRM